MAKERGAAPSRRLPSRSGRASFEADPNEQGDSSQAPPVSAAATEVPGSAAKEGESRSAAQAETEGISGEHNNSAEEIAGASAASGKPGKQASNSDASPSPASIVQAAAPPAAVATPVAHRGRGRPRKKPLEVDMNAPQNSPASPRAPEPPRVAATVTTAAAMEAVTTPAHPIGVGRRASADVGKARDWAKEEEDEGVAGGNESDEWSEDDEVHHLPAEVKAKFGKVSGESRESSWVILSQRSVFLLLLPCVGIHIICIVKS